MYWINFTLIGAYSRITQLKNLFLCKYTGHEWEWFLYQDVLGKMPHYEYAVCKRCKVEAWDYDELY